MLLEHDRGNIRFIDDHVDEGKLRFGKFRCHLFHRLRLRKADGNYGTVTAFGKISQSLLTLAVVLDFEIAILYARILFELLGPVVDAFVE